MIVSSTLLLLILTPIFVSLLLSLPFVQNELVDYASRRASQHLGTEVSVRYIDVTTTGSIRFEDLLIRDLQGDTLIFATQLDTRFMGYSPFDRKLQLGRSKIAGGVLNLQQRSGGDMNIKQVTDLLASDNPNGGFEIEITHAELDEVKLVIELLKHRTTEYGVDYGNMVINNLCAKVDDLNILGSDVKCHIKEFSGTEQSGMLIGDMSGEVEVTNGALSIENMGLMSRWSNLQINKLQLSDKTWGDYRNFVTSTSIYVDVEDGYLSSDDVAYFAPALRTWGMQLDNVNLTARGHIDDLLFDINNISYGDSTHLAAELRLVGLPEVDSTQMEITIEDFVSKATDIESLNYIFSGEEFTPAIYSPLAAAGVINIDGRADGRIGDMTANLNSHSGLGGIATNMRVQWSPTKESSGATLQGDITLDKLALDKVVGKGNMLGKTSAKANIAGRIGSADGGEMSLLASVASIDWRNYTYRNIDLAGRLSANNIRATVGCNDPNLIFAMTASIEDVEMVKSDKSLLSSDSKSELSLNLMHANLKPLGLSRNVESTLAADLSLFAQGDNLEHSKGEIVMRSLKYTHGEETIDSDSASLRFESATGRHTIELESDFASATFQSRDSVSHITAYMSDALRNYLPALYKEPARIPNMSSALRLASGDYGDTKPMVTKATNRRKAANKSNKSELSTLAIEIKDINPILAIIDENMKIDMGSTLDLEFDITQQEFKGRLYSEYIERKSLLAIGVDLNIHNTADSILLHGGVDELYMSTMAMNNAHINATANNNTIAIDCGYQDNDSTSYAAIRTDMTLSRQMAGNRSKPEIDIVLYPSTISSNTQRWDLYAESVNIKHAGIDVDQFVIESADQRLAIDGRASTSTADTVNMTMENFNLSIITHFISQLGYHLDGKTNGRIAVASALDDARLEANIKLDSVSVNTIPAPPMSLDAIWDSKMNRARLTLTNRTNNDMLLRGYYIPSQVSYYADLQVTHLDLGLLDPPLSGVITNTTGEANMRLTLQGERRKASIEGSIDMRDGATTIDFTKVRYNIPKARFNVSNNIISANNIDIDDGRGGRGKLSIAVDIKQLSNIEYNLTVVPDKMLVLNTTERDNDVFYGDLYASGIASIKGDRSGSKMDIAAVSENNSHFFMQLLSKSSISSADFITFIEPTKDEGGEKSLRQIIFERNNSTRSSTSASIEVNMSLDVRPNTEVQLVIDPTVGDIIKSRGEGRFNISLNPRDNVMEMYGDYTISEGSYLFTLSNIINKRFVIEPNSTIQWNGSATEPLLNIDAIYQLKTSLQPLMASESTRAVPVECVINLSDVLTRPDVSFDIEFPSLDSEQQAVVSSMLNDQEVISRQFFYLMLANSFIPESSGIDSEFGVSTTAATGFELLTNQLSNWLSTSNYNVVIRYRPESELTGDEVDIGFSRGLINNRLLLEIEGNYVANGKEALSESGSNLVGEAYLTWLIDQAGALQMKGFTQTIDRFDETQGLQETGVGLSYREEFEDFKDLQQKVLARFAASPERLAKRKEREEARAEKREAKKEMKN